MSIFYNSFKCWTDATCAEPSTAPATDIDELLEAAKSLPRLAKRFDVSPASMERIKKYASRTPQPLSLLPIPFHGTPIAIREDWTGERIEPVYEDE